MKKPSIIYTTERHLAIENLEFIVARFRDEATQERGMNAIYDADDAAIAQTYINAQLALLALMKEESEETDDE